MKKEFGVALKQKPLDEGLTKYEINSLFNMLKGVDAIPIEIQGENASAMGFINLADAEFLNYEYDNDSEPSSSYFAYPDPYELPPDQRLYLDDDGELNEDF